MTLPIPASNLNPIARRRRATAGLILLAVVDLACYAARARWTAANYAAWLNLPEVLRSAEHSYWFGQGCCFGIAAALIASRRYVGLAAAALLALASGTIHAWCLVMIQSRAIAPLDMSFILIQFAATTDVVLATFAVNCASLFRPTGYSLVGGTPWRLAYTILPGSLEHGGATW